MKTQSIKISADLLDRIRAHKEVTGISIQRFIEISVEDSFKTIKKMGKQGKKSREE